MKEWLLSVTAIILLTTVLTIILPEGKTSNLIKNMFSIMSLLVVINPIVNIESIISATEFVFGENEVVADQNYLDYVINKKIVNLENNSLKIIEEYYSNNCFIDIQFTKDNQLNYTIDRVEIDLSNATCLTNDTANTKKEIISKISLYLDVEDNKIFINESN